MPPEKKHPYIYWIIIFILLLYTIPVSFLAFRNFIPGSISPADLMGPESNQLFSEQTATVKGKITSISPNSIVVKNIVGLTGTLPLADTISITDMQDPTATPSANLKSDQVGKDAVIILGVMDGAYKVTAISFQFLPIVLAPESSTSQPVEKTITSPKPLLIPSFSPPIIASPSGR